MQDGGWAASAQWPNVGAYQQQPQYPESQPYPLAAPQYQNAAPYYPVASNFAGKFLVIHLSFDEQIKVNKHLLSLFGQSIRFVCVCVL